MHPNYSVHNKNWEKKINGNEQQQGLGSKEISGHITMVTKCTYTSKQAL